MTEVLGYEQFAVEGGDAGSPLAQILVIDQPKSTVGTEISGFGWHIGNFDIASTWTARKKHLGPSKRLVMADIVYALSQVTRSRTLATILSDSPACPACWVIGRFDSWSGTYANSVNSFIRHELLTYILLHWPTQTIGDSVFNHCADGHASSLTPQTTWTGIGRCGYFPNTPEAVPLRSLAELTRNVQRWAEMTQGVNFASLEELEPFAKEIRTR
jgi:microsomal epoxide hydrolase